MRVGLRLAVLIMSAVLLGCGGGREPEPARAGGEATPVLVFAASDLQAAFSEIEAEFEAATGERLTVVFGSTGNLAAQITSGAPADVFFAANERFLDGLSAAGRIEEESRRVYALGRLALVWRAETEGPGSVGDLARPAFRTIAIANPEHAPYGMAAREALRTAGVWEAVNPRLVYGENIAQALQFVQSGNADAGVVALGLVLGPRYRPHRVVPDTEHAPLRQAAAVVRGSPRADAARRLLGFVTAPEGRAILARYGFDPPIP
jgi:molybdate transport system substrate-binding protein